jgi:hypothetical protein
VPKLDVAWVRLSREPTAVLFIKIELLVVASVWAEVGASKTAVVLPFDPTKQVEQEISPVVEFKLIGEVAETATVPEAFGKVMVLLEAVGSAIAKIV